jgi:sugar phosphate isomerase/epimerase
MNRRDCLRAAGLLASVALVPAACAADSTHGRAAVGSGKRRCSGAIGVQLFAVRDRLVADPRGTLARLGEIGFREVELFGFGGSVFIDDPFFGLSATGFGDALERAGLSAPIAHVSGDFEEISEVAGIASSLGVTSLINPMAPEFLTVRDGQPIVSGVTGREQMEGLAARLNEQGQECERNGIGFGYHNHHMEFESLGGRPAFDFLAENTDPALVKFELDLGWVAVSGQDPIDYIDRYHDRIIAVHMKDYDPSLPIGTDPKTYPIPEQAQLVEPGAGLMDFERIVEALEKYEICHQFVEVDVTTEPMKTVERGYNYLANFKSQRTD